MMAKRVGKGNHALDVVSVNKELNEAEKCFVLSQELEKSGIYESSLSMIQKATEHLELVGNIRDRLYGYTVVANNLSWLASAMADKGSLCGTEYVIASILNLIVNDLDTHQFTFETDQRLCKSYVDCLADCAAFLIVVEDFEQALGIAERALRFIEKCEILVGTSTYGRCVHCKAYILAELGETEKSKDEYVRALRIYVSAGDLSKSGCDDVISSITKHLRSFDEKEAKKNKILSPKRVKRK